MVSIIHITNYYVNRGILNKIIFQDSEIIYNQITTQYSDWAKLLLGVQNQLQHTCMHINSNLNQLLPQKGNDARIFAATMGTCLAIIKGPITKRDIYHNNHTGKIKTKYATLCENIYKRFLLQLIKY